MRGAAVHPARAIPFPINHLQAPIDLGAALGLNNIDRQ